MKTRTNLPTCATREEAADSYRAPYAPRPADTFMVNWAEQKIWCNTCDRWVPQNLIWIDGTHGTTTGPRSTHTLWQGTVHKQGPDND
jgi:hypothetical protein